MKENEIQKTVGMLFRVVQEKQHLYGDDKIRVRIGRELAAWISGYNRTILAHKIDDTIQKTIFGCPVEIDVQNTWCLEVLIVESVPIYRESEV